MSLNLATILSDTAAKHPSHCAIICEGRRLTYRELDKWVSKIAEVLQKQGLQRGDRVLLLAPNVPEFTATYFAILRSGGVVVPVNVHLLAKEVADLLEHSDARFFFCWHSYAVKGREAFEMVDSCRTLFFFGVDSQHLDESVLAHYPISPLHAPTKFVLDDILESVTGDNIDDAQTKPDDTAVILYTSGTTGRSKGAELSHFNVFSNAFYTCHQALFLRHDDVFVAVLPLFHTFGQTAIQNTAVIAGGTLLMVPQFEPKRMLAEIETHRATYLAAVPSIYNLMLQNQQRKPHNTSSLRIVVSGGASLPVQLAEDFQRLFGVAILEGYGLSETSPIVAITHADGPPIKHGSVGSALFGTQIRIMRNDESFAETDEVGEIVVRGHNVMKGYFKDPLATETTFTNGWFRTGDVGKMDADGYVFIVDRKKDVIIRAGMNIYPREIEELLYHHPLVLEVSVIGIPDKTLSEDVIACVVLAEGATITAEEISKYCRDHLARYKCPKTVHIMKSLPKGQTGKILKRELREMLMK